MNQLVTFFSVLYFLVSVCPLHARLLSGYVPAEAQTPAPTKFPITSWVSNEHGSTIFLSMKADENQPIDQIDQKASEDLAQPETQNAEAEVSDQNRVDDQNPSARKADGQDTQGKRVLSRIKDGFDVVRAFALPRVTVKPGSACQTYLPNKPNPLLNRSIEHFTISEGNNDLFSEPVRAVVVTNDQPNVVNIAGIYQNIVTVLSSDPLQDATLDNPAVAQKIVGIGASNEYILAAVTPQSSAMFGDAGSGIAFTIAGHLEVEVERKSDESPLDKKIMPIFKQYDGIIGGPGYQGPIRSLPFDLNSSQLLLASADQKGCITQMGQRVVFCWNKYQQCFYAGVDLSGDGDESTGIRNLVVIHPSKEHGLTMVSMAPDGCFDQNSCCPIGMRGAHTRLTIDKMCTLHTSTALTYLIMVRARSIFALPLVYSDDKKIHGTLAAKGQAPTDLFSEDKTFVGRIFTDPATLPDQLAQETDPAVCIGRAAIPSGTITSVTTAGDAVFISVADDGQQPNASGAFFSRALFDHTGAIKGWTDWQRSLPTTDPTIGVIPNTQNGEFTFLIKDTVSEDVLVKRTDWLANDSHNTTSLAALLSQEFAQHKTGILGIHDFAYATPGLGSTSVAVATGMRKIVLVQTGCKNGAYDCPQKYDDLVQLVAQCTSASIESPITEPLVALTGGVLDQLGAISAAAIATDMTTHAWLIVGGVHGAAILSHPDGSGWSVSDGLGNNFAGLTGMSCTMLGTYRLVRKLIADGPYLYVLTDRQLDRIDTRSPGFGTGQTTATTLACADVSNGDIFFDLLVADACALLATNKGLLRIGNGSDITAAQTPSDCLWTGVSVPDSIGVITQLTAVTPSGIGADLVRGVGGMVYALNSNCATQQARIVRFAVAGLNADTVIDNNTVLPLADRFSKDSLSYLINLRGLANKVASDGFRYMYGSSANNPQNFYVSILAGVPPVRSGQRFIAKSIRNILYTFEATSQLHALGTISATGAWFAAGSFGMLMHQ